MYIRPKVIGSFLGPCFRVAFGLLENSMFYLNKSSS
jgi:hypothetical protein